MIKKIIIYIIISVSISALYSQEIIPSNQIDKSNITTKKLYDYRPIDTNNDEFELDIKFFQLNYKLWTLYGEPVFDFKLKWNGEISVLTGIKLKNIPEWFEDKHGSIGSLDLDDDLQSKMKKIKPLNFEFIFSLYDKNQGSYGALKTSNHTYEQYLYDDDRNLSLIKYKHFQVDVLEQSGKISKFSVPGSPDWDDLHPAYLEIIKNLKDFNDLAIYQLRVVNIEWPQYEIESILVEQINRNKEKEYISQEIDNSDDFWDTPDTNTSKDEIPKVQVQSKKETSSNNKQSQREQQKLKSLKPIDEILSFDTSEDKAISINVDMSLNNYTIKGIRDKKQIWIKEQIDWRSIKLSDIEEDFDVQFWNHGILIGTVRIDAENLAKPVYTVGDTGPAGGIVFYDKGEYSDGWRYLEAEDPFFKHSSFSKDNIIQNKYNYNSYDLSKASNFSKVGSGYVNTIELSKISYEANKYIYVDSAIDKVLSKQVNGFNDWFIPSLNELIHLVDFFKNWDEEKKFIKKENYNRDLFISKYASIWSSTIDEERTNTSNVFFIVNYWDQSVKSLTSDIDLYIWPIRMF